MADSSTTSTVVTAVLSAGGTGVFGLLIKAVTDRRKNSADAAAVILKAGTDQVISQAAQLERQSGQLKRQDERIEELENQVQALLRLSRARDQADWEHSLWDERVYAQLTAADIIVSPPPRLGAAPTPAPPPAPEGTP